MHCRASPLTIGKKSQLRFVDNGFSIFTVQFLLQNSLIFKFLTIAAYNCTVVLLCTKCHNIYQYNAGALNYFR